MSIAFLVKHPRGTEQQAANLYYRDIGDYLTREDKLARIDADHLATIDWQTITPNAAGDWINQRGDEFDTYQPLGSKEPGAIFALATSGLKSNRDAWVVNFSPSAVRSNVERMVNFYNQQVREYAALPVADQVERFIDTDPAKFSWDRADRQRLGRGRTYAIRSGALRVGTYRPFIREYVWFDAELNNTVYQLPHLFPSPAHPNHGIYQVGAGSAVPFSVLGLDALPDLHVTGAGSGGQFYARYTYEPLDPATVQGAFDLSEASDAVVIDSYRRLDNITDATLATYRTWYGSEVTKDQIFAFVYGLLHSPDYRERFAADLKRSLPRIPRIETEDYPAFRDAGQRLLDLHIGYEDVEPYPLTVTGDHPMGAGSGDLYGWFRVEKLKWGGRGRVKDRSTIVYNNRITISGIPDEAHEYMLGSRSALEWVIDRYQLKTDKPSGIVNDPNDYSREIGNPRYILDLVAKVTRVSVATVGVVAGLPPLRIVEKVNESNA